MNVSARPVLYQNKGRILLRALILIGLLLTAACATDNRPVRIDASRNRIGTKRDPQGIEGRLWTEYQQWRGTRHAMGGTSRRGVDCSGFVQAVYKDLFDIDLPRTTKDQVRVGKPVARNDLRPGDLVFFHPPSYPRHVGIYFRHNQFVHASKTKGVTISSIGPEYWGRYYWTARRVARQK